MYYKFTLKRTSANQVLGLSFSAFLPILQDLFPGLAELSISSGRTQKLSEIINATPRADVALLVHLQELAGELRFAQRPAKGGFGRASLKPLGRFLTDSGGRLTDKVRNSFEWWAEELPKIAPREGAHRKSGSPDRIYS